MIQHLGDAVLTCDECGKDGELSEGLSYGDDRFDEVVPDGWYQIIRSEVKEPILANVFLQHKHYCSLACLRKNLECLESDLGWK